MMKRHLSVLMLAARSTVFKFFWLLVAMAAAEGALFYLALRKAQAAGTYGLEHLITQSRIPLVCGVCFLILCALLSLYGCELRGGKLRYTIKRLSVREETTFFWWALYNALIFLAFWAAQLALALLLCRLYTVAADPAYVSRQTIFLAFYRHRFLHSLLPMEETSRYVRNAVLMTGLGVSAASFSFLQRNDKRGVAVVLLAAVTIVMFPRDMGSFGNDLLVILVTLAVAAAAAVNIREAKNDED